MLGVDCANQTEAWRCLRQTVHKKPLKSLNPNNLQPVVFFNMHLTLYILLLACSLCCLLFLTVPNTLSVT